MRGSSWTLGVLLVAACRAEPARESSEIGHVASAATVSTTVDATTALKVTATAADVACNGDGQLTITMEQSPPLRYSLVLDDGASITAAGFATAKSIATSIVQAKTNARFDVLRAGWKNSLDFAFSTIQSTAIVTDAIAGLAYRGTDERDLETALEIAAQDHDTTAIPSSPWSITPRVAVIITDGHVDAGACNAVGALTSRGILPVVVTVGPDVETNDVACLTGGGARLITSFSMESLDAAVRTAIPQDFVLRGAPGSAFTFIEPFTTSSGTASLVGNELEWRDNPSASLVVPFHHSAGWGMSPVTLLDGLSLSRKSSPATTAALPDVTINVTGPCITIVDSVTLTTSDNPSLAHRDVTFTAKIASTGAEPEGTVVFADGATPLGTSPIAAGRAVFQTAALAAGTHTITATYGAAAASLTQLVNPATLDPPAETSDAGVGGGDGGSPRDGSSSRDGGSSGDGGSSSSPPPATDGGCGCRTAPASNRGSFAFVAGLGLWLLRRRRR